MKVKDLINQLRAMPQNLEVNYAHHDNEEHEIAGYVNSVEHMVKDDIELPIHVGSDDQECFDGLPKEWVVIR